MRIKQSTSFELIFQCKDKRERILHQGYGYGFIYLFIFMYLYFLYPHKAFRELEIAPPGELESVPLLGGHFALQQQGFGGNFGVKFWCLFFGVFSVFFSIRHLLCFSSSFQMSKNPSFLNPFFRTNL